MLIMHNLMDTSSAMDCDRESICGTSSTSSVGRLGADGGSFVPQHDEVCEELGPVPRDRCNTWPMRRPNLDINAQTSPLIHEQIPEEETDMFESTEHLGPMGSCVPATVHSPEPNNTLSGGMSPMDSVCASDSDPTGKKSTTRRNAWGNMSYADLITQAIIQSPEKRLTLSQVYEWMVQNVPYFRDKGDSNSSAGWKNSIRHNLSLHSRFMRIQNEGAGKSSWWVINPDAKPGRSVRRTRERATTIDVTNKGSLKQAVRGARKKVKEMRMGPHESISTRDLYDEESMSGGFEPMFRPRTQSNLSVPGSSARVSPSMEHPFDDFDFPPWVDTASSVPIPNDIVDRTDQMRIDPSRCGMVSNGGIQVKQEQKPMKFQQESVAPPPPSYHELNSVRGPCAQNPLLRNQMVAPAKMYPGVNMYPAYSAWPTHTPPISTSCGIAQQQTQSLGSALPMDLENLTLPDQPLMDVDMDIESVLRHELSQTRDHQLNFDL